MAKEIERKYLVNRAKMSFLSVVMDGEPIRIRQGYISDLDTGVVRVRIADDVGFLTVKGPTIGITRNEFEYVIPKDDAEDMLDTMCDKIISKHRYIFKLPNDLKIEIDIFLGSELIIAEIELPSEDTVFDKPDWLGLEVSDDPAYFNNNIAARIGK
jgi:adenylate cyclase